MAREEASLRDEMGKLEIEPIKLNKPIKDQNPFVSSSQPKKWLVFKPCIQYYKCLCSLQKKNKSRTICKRKHDKVLRQPILKLSQHLGKTDMGIEQKLSNQCGLSIHKLTSDNLNLKTLVDNCNQLCISSGSSKKYNKTEPNDKTKWWKNDFAVDKQGKECGVEKSPTGSCSQQALNPPCDVTIDELASYFETLVHIPKKMSSMAEMMYI